MASRKKMVRFLPGDDLKLLREVAAQNPFALRTKWSVIAAHLSTDDFMIDGRRARERTELMLAKFKSEEKESRKQYVVLNFIPI